MAIGRGNDTGVERASATREFPRWCLVTAGVAGVATGLRARLTGLHDVDGYMRIPRHRGAQRRETLRRRATTSSCLARSWSEREDLNLRPPAPHRDGGCGALGDQGPTPQLVITFERDSQVAAFVSNSQQTAASSSTTSPPRVFAACPPCPRPRRTDNQAGQETLLLVCVPRVERTCWVLGTLPGHVNEPAEPLRSVGPFRPRSRGASLPRR